jgi:putative salt-induced outer membrane protein YdiY
MRCPIALVVCALLTAGAAIAQDPPPPPAPIWSGSLGAGLASTTGNTDTQNWNISFKANRKPKTGVAFAAEGLMIRGSKDGKLSTDNSLLRSRLDLKYADKAYVFGQVQYLRNPFKSIDYFWANTAGLGYRFFDSAAGTFSVDLSGGASWEKNVGKPVRTRSAVAFGEKYAKALSKTATFTHAFSGNVVADDVNNGLYTTSVGVAAAVTNRTQVKVEALDTYRTTPPNASINKRDLSTVVSFVYKF